jgi:hypothetical protein
MLSFQSMARAWEAPRPANLSARSGRSEAVGVAFLYAFAALGVVQKYIGTVPALALLLLSPLVGPVAAAPFWLVRGRVTARHAKLAAALLLLVAVVALLVIYPHANTHATGGGSDRDDAATIGARGFLHARDPYGSVTYLRNPISQLPTLLVVAMPFVGLFGSSAYELVLFLPLLYVLFRWVSRDAGAALAGLVIVLVSPAVLRDYLTGGDLVANVVLVGAAVFAVWQWPASIIAAATLGVALATRLNFALVLVPLTVAVACRIGRAAAIRRAVVTIAVLAAITIPVAASTGGRAALRMNDKLSEVPGGAPLILAIACVVAAGLALRTVHWTATALFAQIAAVQALLLVPIIVTDSFRAGSPDFFWLISGYGVPAFVFSIAASVAGGRGTASSHART